MMFLDIKNSLTLQSSFKKDFPFLKLKSAFSLNLTAFLSFLWSKDFIFSSKQKQTPKYYFSSQ